MSIYSIKHIKGDKRLQEYKIWSKWMDQILVIRNRFHELDPEDNPFAYNETTSVGCLQSGASMAGFTTLAEYETTKRLKLDRRRRNRGRADLWIYCPYSDVSWSYEFKQLQKSQFSEKSLSTKLSRAIQDARHIYKDEADKMVGGIIATTQYCNYEIHAKYNERCEQFALETDSVHQAWAIKAGDDDPATYLFFSVLK